MTDASVSTLRLPRLRTNGLANRLARRAIIQLLERLATGSLLLHERGETRQFGNRDSSGPHAEITVHNDSVWRQLMLGGSVGSGEAYILGHWSSPDLVQVTRLFTANLGVLAAMDSRQSWLQRLGRKIMHALNNNSLRGSRRNISAHYDLGNEFFNLFLDSSMMYSAAIFPERDTTLEAASEHKLARICRELRLSDTDHLLEIGTGWGGMAIYAAKHYGCRVTTTTISREQYEYARLRVREAGLEDRVTVLCEDYRELEGQYDKLVSIEMIEAVGHQYYATYFNKCSSLLKPEGLMVIQAITMAEQRYEMARDNVDFIKRYIFPGGCLPSLQVISNHLAVDTDMQVIDLFDMTAHYAETLAHWRRRFFDQLDAVSQQGFDSLFQRMWEFYFCYCEGGFRERAIGTVQLTLAKPGFRFD